MLRGGWAIHCNPHFATEEAERQKRCPNFCKVTCQKWQSISLNPDKLALVQGGFVLTIMSVQNTQLGIWLNSDSNSVLLIRERHHSALAMYLSLMQMLLVCRPP